MKNKIEEIISGLKLSQDDKVLVSEFIDDIDLRDDDKFASIVNKIIDALSENNNNIKPLLKDYEEMHTYKNFFYKLEHKKYFELVEDYIKEVI